ncbi:ATP-grasp domain-containing protein [Acinetobacter indicus]|uniref:ATP-grasp domain-containing protein n=1 Tax=Acinetobacter indicus TaxID=756892 RepID=UPI000CEC4AE2|nr:ATP-grasp domain-containing protein [Acinetobacter indicus]
MKDVVITANTAIGSVLALAQSLKETPCKIYVVCTDKKTCNILKVSNFIDEVNYIYSADADSYLIEFKKLYEIKKFKGKPILYSTTDTSCFYINENRDWFENSFELSLPSKEIVYNFTKKGIAEEKAKLSGLYVPKTIVIKNSDDINVVINNFNFPVILKPQATYLNKTINFKIKVFDTKKEFLNFCKCINEDILCQEFIPGGNDSSYYCIFYRNKKGNLYTNIGKKIMQSTSKGGIMFKGISENNNEIFEICRNFLEKIEYTGIGGVEFKKHCDKFYFIEMSVRLEGFFKLAEVSGSNLSLISYYDLCGYSDNKGVLCQQRDGCLYVDTVPLFISYIKSGNLQRIFLDAVNIIFRNNFYSNVLSRKDLKPFIKQILILLKNRF